MSLGKISTISWLLLTPAGVLTLIYTLLGTVGGWIFGGRIAGPKDIIFLIYPLLAFPLYLSVFKSLKWATILLWLYFLFVWGFSIVLSWPRVLFNPLSSVVNQLLFIALVLVLAAYIVESRAHRVDSAI
jgi:hypothetical protein